MEGAVTREIVETLKRVLKARGMTYAELARALRVSTPTVKRMFSEKSFTLERLEAILGVLETDLYEVAKLAREANGGGKGELSVEQETALAKDTRLFSIFWLVTNEWTFDEILAEFRVSAAQLTAYYARLARLRLIDWRPGNRTRLTVPKRYVWRRGGPLRKVYGARVINEFVRSRFDSPVDAFHFDAVELTHDSALVVKRRLERVAAEINALIEADAAAPAKKRVALGVLLAFRPWANSIVHTLREDPDALKKAGRA
ncbi:MAG TPA: helix-turn-helix transcriptional regulator [Burkholderiales bacterium]|nr:helix-turn-helix transcriptional regulator [Burkholderiales bacterium]